MNHVPHLPRSFTCVVDSTPIKIWNSGDSAVDHRTYSGKDRYHCLKAVFVVTIGTNMPVAGCGLFLPKVYDGWLAEELDFNAQFARDPREWFLGDGHFSCAPRYLTPPKKPTWTPAMKTRGDPNPHMSAEQLAVYNILQMIRAPVEPMMEEFKKPGMFKGFYRGCIRNLQTCFAASMHARARDIYIRADAQGNRRRGFGPFSHF